MSDLCTECGGAGIYVASGEIQKCPCEGVSSYKCPHLAFEDRAYLERVVADGIEIGLPLFQWIEPVYCFDCSGWHTTFKGKR